MIDDAPFPGNPFDGHDLEDVLLVEALMGWDGASCARCGKPLGNDEEDELGGDAARPICGECSRRSNVDVARR